MAIYYVSTTGKNTDPGTLEKPWRTLAYAESKLSSGDVVTVRGGVYQEYFKIDVAGVTFQNYLGESPIIDGSLRENAIGVYHNMVYIEGADNVIIDGFILQNSAGRGIYIGHSKYVTIKNCEIGHSEREGLVIIYDSNNVLIEDCDIHHNAKQVFLYCDGFGGKCRTLGWGDPASVISKYLDNLVVRRTKIHNSYNEGINLDVGTTNALVEYCEIYGNYKSQFYLCSSTGHTVRYNLIYGTDFSDVSTTFGGAGIEINHESSWLVEMGNPVITNHKIYGNLIANLNTGIRIGGNIDRSSQNVNVYGNTLVHNTQYGISIFNGVGQNSVFKNNIIFNPLGQISNVPGGITFDYNLWSRTPDVDSQGPNDPPYAPPKLTKTSGWNNLIGGELIPEDFMLQPDSPAIDKGTYIDGMTHDFFGTPIPQGSAPDIGAIEYTLFNPCEGVVCDNICIGKDLWSQKCVDGDCIPDQLIESNSTTCGYDPCEGVVCDNVCVGDDLWSRKCVDGDCVPDQLIESNSISCGYDPCEGVVCDNVCVGDDLWSRKCVDGSCVPDQLIESNSVTCELCEGVVCDNICVGDDLWSQRCDSGTGNCVADQLLQQDSINCTIPDQVPSDESTIKTYIILGGFGLMGLAMLILRKK